MKDFRLARAWLMCLTGGLLFLRPAVARVELEGVADELRENVLAHLLLDDAGCDAPPWRVRRLTRQADRQIREALEAYGYYTPVIAVDSANSPGCWLVRITIKPGDPVRLREVNVSVSGEAQSDKPFQRLLFINPLQRGDVLNHPVYEKYKKSFFDLARQRGYFSGGFTASKIEVHAADRAADITLSYVSGPRYRFGPVSFEQDVVDPKLVERFVDFHVGDHYDGVRIVSLYNALVATGYFASVDVRTDPKPPPDLDVPVLVRLTRAKRQVYTVGAGYSTDTGPKFRAGYTNRRLNESGHQFDADLSLSSVLSEVGVRYRLPREDPRVEWLSFDAGYQYKDTTTSLTETYKVGVKSLRRRRAEWIETRFLDVSIENFKIADEWQRELLVLPGMSWSHTGADNITRPDKGHRVTLKVSGTTHYIGSDSDFLQAEASGKLIVPAWTDARLLLRGEIGATIKDKLRTLPASVRYFAGGDNSVRGYAFESLGPVDENGKVVGGSHKLSASVEIDQHVWGKWSVAAFVDSGNAFDNFSDMNLKTGVGAGVRWYSPLGPVRVDIAVPLERDAPDSFRIHVTLGPDL